ncbi:hypothetical protein [Sphingomonas sp. R86521]|uniref:hypothetical protein n=1 Tax=Sphingomonas sp. R86521 TaxID=3093860 RepID=UPI0036D2A7A8
MTQPAAGSIPTDVYAGDTTLFLRSPVSANNVPSSRLGAPYVGYVKWVDSSAVRYLLFGARTLPGNMRKNETRLLIAVDVYGTATLTLTFSTGAQSDYICTARLIIDYTFNTVYGTINFDPTVFNQTQQFDGVFDPLTGRISGKASFSSVNNIGIIDDSWSGRFEGAAYGPLGVNVAMLVTMTRSDGTAIIGVVGWSYYALQ